MGEAATVGEAGMSQEEIMSSHQSPGHGEPEGAPGYAPPQDPWAGGWEPTLASAPTDPIPQQYGLQQTAGAGQPWSGQVAPSGYLVQPPPRRTGLIALYVAIILAVAGGGGFAAWYFTGQFGKKEPAAQEFDPLQVKVGDCLVNNGTQERPKMAIVACDTPNSVKVIKVVNGPNIPRNAEGKFDDLTTSVAMCGDTDYDFWYGWQDRTDRSRDRFFCLVEN